ncbi:hypothetical protein ADUPG1_013107 [Aduncisulcus paluster]|uniref:BTB domain-containing protein n=1 Tax=Aduncisulcus paluster TaxID=2918883 RepID=A0ABQ5K1T4_9EUKA|nr:hypothetical protein ADUPG1_013107 [Aduncisulcus paluster]
MVPTETITVFQRIASKELPKSKFGRQMKISSITAKTTQSSYPPEHMLSADERYYQSNGGKPHEIYIDFKTSGGCVPSYFCVRTDSSHGSYHPSDIQLAFSNHGKEQRRCKAHLEQFTGWHVIKFQKAVKCSRLTFEIHENHSSGYASKVIEVRVFGGIESCKQAPQRDLILSSLREVLPFLDAESPESRKKEEEEEEPKIKAEFKRFLEACPFDFELRCKDGIIKAHSILLSAIIEVRVFGGIESCKQAPQRDLILSSLREVLPFLDAESPESRKKEEEEEEPKIKAEFKRFLEACPFDFELRCKDGIIKAHSILLSASSGYFRHLMRSRKCVDGVSCSFASFPEILCKHMRAIVRFIYGGDNKSLALVCRGENPTESLGNLRDMYMLSRRLHIPSLDCVLEDMIHPALIEMADTGGMEWVSRYGSDRLLRLGGLGVIDNIEALNESGGLEKLPPFFLKGIVEGLLLDFDVSSVSGKMKKEPPKVSTSSAPNVSEVSSWVPYPDVTVEVGHVIRVKPSVTNVAYGWGSISHADYGVVTAVTSPTECRITFSGSTGWMGRPSELDVYGPPGFAASGGIPSSIQMCSFMHKTQRGGLMKKDKETEPKEPEYSYLEM